MFFCRYDRARKHHKTLSCHFVGVHVSLVHSLTLLKTEHLSTRETPLPMKLNGEELKNVDHFKYLGSVIDKDGTINKDVDLRVQAAWSSWRKLTGVLYDRKIPQAQSKGV